MENDLITQLLAETIECAEEDGSTSSLELFKKYVEEMLPPDLLRQLEDINGSIDFLEDIWKDRFEVITPVTSENETMEDMLKPGVCLICERYARLTRHHVFPRETHRTLIKKGYDAQALNTTIAICRMCHSTIHRFFTNDELAEAYYTVELLLADDKYLKYAKWASKQSTDKKSCVDRWQKELKATCFANIELYQTWLEAECFGEIEDLMSIKCIVAFDNASIVI